jgi:hypothetical protein
MSGGTLTPPRDPTWETEALIAPVIPFRQRGEQPERPVRDEREHGAPIVVVPADTPGSSWIHQGTGLLAHETAAQLNGEATAPWPRRKRPFLVVALVALALGVGVASTFAFAGGGRPHPAPRVSRQAAVSTRSTNAVSSHTHHGSTTGARKPVHHATVTHEKHAAKTSHTHVRSHTLTSKTTPPTFTPQQTSATTPAVNPCYGSVPGQLGC